MATFRHGKSTRVIVDSADLSRQLNQAQLQAQQDTPETTGFTSSVKSYVVGLPDGKLDLQGMYSADSTGKDDTDDVFHRLSDATSPVTVTYCPEGLPGAPAAGSNALTNARRCYSFSGYLNNFQIRNAVADVVAVQASFSNANQTGFDSGIVLEDRLTTALSATSTTPQAYGVSYYDYGSSAARTGWIAIHITDFTSTGGSGGNWTITVSGAASGPTTAGNYTVSLGSATLSCAYDQSAPKGGAVFIPITTATSSFQYVSVKVDAPTGSSSGAQVNYIVTANLA